jgi:hypothetical protein
VFCANCKARIAQGQNFCNACGMTTTAAVPPSAGPAAGTVRGRVERHLQVLAILWLVWSALRLVPGIGLLFFGSFALPFLPFGLRALVLPVAAFAGVWFMASSIAGFIAGWGLMQRQSWARILVIILAILTLIHFPLGTGLGIYTLWVILPAESEAEYRRLSRPTSY